MRDRTPKLDRAFGAAPWLHNLPPDLIEALKAAAKSAPSSRVVGSVRSATCQTFLSAWKSGVMALHTDNEEQLDTIGHIFAPGDWYGVAAILVHTPRFIGSSALTDARVVQVSRREIERIAAQHPILWRAIAVLSAMNTQLATRVARDALIKSPAERCAATLLELAGRQPLPCELPLTQSQFAEICGLSRGAVAKALSDLELAGKVARGYASITVKNGATDVDFWLTFAYPKVPPFDFCSISASATGIEVFRLPS